jgi:hypothetical protein
MPDLDFLFQRILVILRSISSVLLVGKSIWLGDGCSLGQPPVNESLVRLAEDPRQPPVGPRGVAIAVGGPVPESKVQLIVALSVELITSIYQCCGSGSVSN